MATNNVKIRKIDIENIKNVSNGTISCCSQGLFNSDIIGVYGQNGSGKTAIIGSVELIQNLIEGQQLSKHFKDYISVKTNTGKITVLFDMNIDNANYEVSYSVDLAIENDKFILKNEDLKISNVDKNENLVSVLNCDIYDNEKILSPQKTLSSIINDNKENKSKLLAYKILSQENTQSFIFNPTFINLITVNNSSEDFVKVIKALQRYARVDLFVVKNSTNGVINLNALIPIFFRYEEDKLITKGTTVINLNGPSLIPENLFLLTQKLIRQINMVIIKIIPDFQIEIKELGRRVSDNNSINIEFELLSHTNGLKFPLRNESEGVKKIISVLQALINFYNRSSVMVFIDEFDSGIFEYLFGEMLEVLQEGGKGQLFFTSHNLRPLEKLNKDSIYFTTCNPNNRYIKLTNVKANNNLRDFYYRAIQLGGQKEYLYKETDLEQLDIAFRLVNKDNASKHSD